MNEIPENSQFIEGFLRDVSGGKDFIPDIWVDRTVQSQGTGSEFTTANSLSRQSISTLEGLLVDDLNYCFNKGIFTFRFIAAVAGSGKTSLLHYLQELIRVSPRYSKKAIVVYFDLSKLLSVSNSQSFGIKFYSKILAETLWKMLCISDIRGVATSVLKELFGNDGAQILIDAERFEMVFQPRFNRSFADISSNYQPQEVLFHIISLISEMRSEYTFVYLVDELDDALKGDEHGQLKSIFKSLLNDIYREYKDEIRLMMYLAGTSEIVKKFIGSDRALERRVSQSVVNLVAGHKNEFEGIKNKINQRIRGAYGTYDRFEEAYREIESIRLDNPDSKKFLSDFCRDYAGIVREIYGRYFEDKSERFFEGTPNELSTLIKEICEQVWRVYIRDSNNYEIKFESLRAKDHTFNCYAKLFKNGHCVASAYGGARNYEILSRYADEFTKRLELVEPQGMNSSGQANNIAFIIAPDCSPLLQEKLKLNQIQWVNPLEFKIVPEENHETEAESTKVLEQSSLDINTAKYEELVRIFSDTYIGPGIINDILSKVPYKDLDELFEKVSNLGQSRRSKIQEKYNQRLICFKFGAFLSYNRKDKKRVEKIAEQLYQQGVAVWMDVNELQPGEVWQQRLEEFIESDIFRTAVVFISKNNIGPWQRREIDAFIRKDISTQSRLNKNYPIIPVILRSRGERPLVPPNLQGYGWVDLNNRNPDPLKALSETIKRYSA
ncbi:MAG: toll/interleukin-1 receptor domain-containing protein [Oculatellaceae cyanobacterium bins.114]|nr:toll/interleukin-1 receptor domain-containing protein [Oculatellaceae cyanobacterium bins.114]